MKLVATVKSIIEDSEGLSIQIRGWAETDSGSTRARSLGTINIPSNERTRKAYYIGRRVVLDVRPL